LPGCTNWPADLYRKIEPDLVAQAAQVSADAIMRSCSFASLFGAFGNYTAERRVLEQVSSALPPGQHFQRVADSLATLAEGARLNANRQTRAIREGERRSK